jgi:hypothetical protein
MTGLSTANARSAGWSTPSDISALTLTALGTAEVLDDNQKQRLIAMVCSNPPERRARWTVRLVAEEAVKRKLVPRVG